jgi:hypothetical protein
MDKRRVAIYVRVSREEQDSVNQFNQLRDFAAGLGQVVKTYDDTGSGKNGDRPAFKQMLDDAAKRRFDLVVFWALDPARFASLLVALNGFSSFCPVSSASHCFADWTRSSDCPACQVYRGRTHPSRSHLP